MSTDVSLSLPQDHALSRRQRERLLTEIVSVFKDKFRRTFVEPPPQFASAFEQLQNADFVDYELILTGQLQTLRGYLQQQIDNAKEFRSPTSHLSFQDLVKQVDLFTRVRVNEVLGLIYQSGLAKDRERALATMDYQIQTLSDQEQKLLHEQEVVTGLLQQTQNRAQNYVLATKGETMQGDRPVLDQGLIDSLLANDAYNMLVRRALDAGILVKDVQTEKAIVVARRKRLETAPTPADETAAVADVNAALAKVQDGYDKLLGDVRTCLEDYARQEYANAARITRQATTKSWLVPLLLGAIIGGFTGVCFGLAFSLLDQRPTRSALDAAGHLPSALLNEPVER